MRRLPRRAWALVAVALVAVALVAGGLAWWSAARQAGGPHLLVRVLSSPARFVSGGDALVEVQAPLDVDLAELEVVVRNGRSRRVVTGSFEPVPGSPTVRRGLVEGLPLGPAVIDASAAEATGTVTVVNHPVEGPMFAGDPIDLAAGCTTEELGLAPATPEEGCTAPTEVTWGYVDRQGRRRPLPDPATVPVDAEVVTVAGEARPFVVRTEVGVINRAVYRIDLLEPRGRPGRAPDTSAWNRRLVYRFGGGCGATASQGVFGVDLPPLELLRRGYATATATFNTLGVLCNDLLSAETASMVKEHVIEAYGLPDHTIGEGSSGGAIQQLVIAQGHPGLLDAIAPALPFPDAPAVWQTTGDCLLLDRWFDSAAGAALDARQRAAVTGYATDATCRAWDAVTGAFFDPVAGCLRAPATVVNSQGAAIPPVPAPMVYDPTDNPDGVRCTIWDANVALLGRRAADGPARSGFDNRGVPYGLDALNDGVISLDQFLELNEGVGGFDVDGHPAAERSAVSADLAERVYHAGRVLVGGGGLSDVPVLLVQQYADEVGDVHDRGHALAVRAVVSGEAGDRAPVALWTAAIGDLPRLADVLGGEPVVGPVDGLGDGLAVPTIVLDEWLTAAQALRADRGGSWRAALREARPGSAMDRCLPPNGDWIVGRDANADPACVAAFPAHEHPRTAAGAPRGATVVACRRVPVVEALDGFRRRPVGGDVARLERAFPDGLCDWSHPGRGASPAPSWPSIGPGS